MCIKNSNNSLREMRGAGTREFLCGLRTKKQQQSWERRTPEITFEIKYVAARAGGFHKLFKKNFVA